MWILLLVMSFLILIIYLGYLISKLDAFLADEGFETEDAKDSPTAIVLGTSELAKQVCELLENNMIHVLPTIEPFLLEQELNFFYLFALSENDADNIILSKIGKKIYSIEKMISLCNDRRNECIFNSEKIPYLSGEEVTAQKLYQFFLQEMEEKS